MQGYREKGLQLGDKVDPNQQVVNTPAHQPLGEQIVFSSPLICTTLRRNPTTSSTNQGIERGVLHETAKVEDVLKVDDVLT